ncbi:type II toxin-antitoxin system RelE/ParE family toxin [Fulvimarina sp. 2208YS6-2-32]|uniref:Type II toxin-antitoxin system RelE/ParE family toxin n=1 Tax=Fulvimarina uroteuthidis TaxID=3098149 RepID=A0ABU5I256_9HYPH|nr:type II toxin-antitoxin system RelE/ParE family toxin [Fulvimarina sp. 2208YS6-2-32]MDY8109457.1 type II toxin-antitoxin system RelE/ParE family toxin [Fulvimarina sp. 2208YS6-2-32]
MRIIYEPDAFKALMKMPAKDRDAIDAKLERYALTGTGDVTRMVGTPEYRLRHRHWRAIFVIEDDMLVLRIAHRSVVYRRG